MGETKTDEICDRCKKQISILVTDFERIMKDGDPVLCPDCETKALDEQIEEEKPLKRCFDYCIIPIKFCDLNEYGKAGWRFVTIYDGDAYFEKEYYEDA